MLIGGRGKAGGVKLAADEAEVREHAGNILGMDISGHIVRTLWIEHASDIASEYYASVLLDRSAKKPLVMFSVEGGVDIEEVAEQTPEKLIRHHVDPLGGALPRGGRADRDATAAPTRTSSTASPTRSWRCTRCGCRRTRRWPRSTR